MTHWALVAGWFGFGRLSSGRLVGDSLYHSLFIAVQVMCSSVEDDVRTLVVMTGELEDFVNM